MILFAKSPLADDRPWKWPGKISYPTKAGMGVDETTWHCDSEVRLDRICHAEHDVTSALDGSKPAP